MRPCNCTETSFKGTHTKLTATMASQPGDIGASKEHVAAQKPARKAGDLSARVEDEADVPDPDEDDLDDLDGM